MLTNPVEVNNGASNIQYEYRGSQVDSSVYRNVAAAMDQPQSFNVKHQTINAGKDNQQRRSVYQFTRVCENAEGVQGTSLCQLQLTIPDKVMTTAQLKEELYKVLNFLVLMETTDFAKITSGDI